MQDRVSLYPGRVKLVPVSGQENTYDMVRADSPTQEGTPLNKDSLLKDATAALYGLDETAVPDDVFSAIKTILTSLNSGIDATAKIATGSYVGTGTGGKSDKANSLTFDFAPDFVWIYAYKTSGVYSNIDGDTTKIATENLTTDYAINSGFSNKTYSSGSAYTKKSSDGKTVSWYITGYSDGRTQWNQSGYTYYYFAIKMGGRT